jgi:hypothetical protein
VRGPVEDGSGPPIACDLSVFTPSERREHFERSRRVLSSLDDLGEEPDGFTFTFPASAELEEEVRLWSRDERRCCPFFRFDLRREADGGLVVRVSGPEAAKEILRAGFAENGVNPRGARRAAPAPSGGPASRVPR